MDEPPWRPGWSGGRFKMLETTADIGVVAQGESLPAAVASAAAGLYFVMSPSPATPRGKALFVSGEADDLPVALARALQQLLVAFDTQGLLGATGIASVQVGERARVTLEVRGEPFDPGRHEGGVEVKAVTHHGLIVDRAARRVEVLFDI